MKRFVFSIIVVLSMFIACSAQAQLTVYDDFSGPFLDTEQWYHRTFMTDTGAVWAYEGGFKIVKGKLNYFNRAYGALLDTDATLYVRRHMYLKDIEYIKGMEASIQVVKNGFEIMNACPAQNAVPSETRIAIGGPFFNDGTGSAPGSGSAIGDITAFVGFYKFSDSTVIPPGYMGVRARLWRCSNDTCSQSSQILETTFDDTLVKIGKKTVLRITWDQASKTFTFNVGKKTVDTLTYTQDDSRRPEYVVGNARIAIDHYLSNCPGTGNAPRSVGWGDILVDYISTDPKVWP
jgi:hypothetical protein